MFIELYLSGIIAIMSTPTSHVIPNLNGIGAPFLDVACCSNEPPVGGELVHGFWAGIQTVGNGLRLLGLQIFQITHSIRPILRSETQRQLLSVSVEKT